MLFSKLQFDPTPTAASHRILPMNPARRSITFYPSGDDTVTLTGNDTTVAGAGLILLPGAAPLYLHVDFQGEAVCQQWTAAYTTGGLTPLAWIEALE